MRILDKNRGKYKRTFGTPGCVFCDGDPEMELPKLSGERWLVRVNRYPYMDGNVMIIPRRHVENTADLTAEEWQEFGQALARTQSALEKAFGCRSFNIGMNLGPDSGASIPHLHWQVIPRKVKNMTVANVFGDLYVVGTTPEEAKRLLDSIAGS